MRYLFAPILLTVFACAASAGDPPTARGPLVVKNLTAGGCVNGRCPTAQPFASQPLFAPVVRSTVRESLTVRPARSGWYPGKLLGRRR